jgi:hypothetical protein
VSAGITGHQDLGDADTTRWIREALLLEISRRPVDLGLTSLAAGADQLFTETLLAAGIPYEVVLPSARYEDAFSDDDARARFHSLLARARRVHQLPFATPGEEAYFEAGKWIVSRCDLLFAVWNGLPARGLGGTGDVVKYAQSVGRSILHIDPTARTVCTI